MRRLRIAALFVALLIFAAPVWSDEPCQYAHVVDRCGKRVVILPIGDDSESYVVALDEGPAAAYEPRGVALATVPDWGADHAFVAQGPYLHVVDYYSYNDEKDITPVRTINTDTELYLPPVELTGMYAAGPIEHDGNLIYPLYVTGTLLEPPRQPWLMIFDQEELLASPTLNRVLIYSSQVGTADGRGIDVTAGASFDGGATQEGFISVLNDVIIFSYQRFYKITVQAGVGINTSLDPWNDEGLPFTGSADESLGLDFESTGTQPYGVLQTSRAVSDLRTGETSCDLAGDPSDIEVWGPDDGLDRPYVQFVSVPYPTGSDFLLGFPEGVCPFTEYLPPEAAPGVMKANVGEMPLALALSSDTSSPLWAYTANGSGGVSAIRVGISHDPVDGDTIEVLEQFNLNLGGCPSAIAVRDEAYEQCMIHDIGDPPAPRPEDFCDENPFDPWCLRLVEAKPSHR